MRFFLIFILAFFTQNVWAATTTQHHVFGFSKDGRYFVFEEFAVYDGAGLPEAKLFVIDTQTDKWFPGTPFVSKREEGEVKEVENEDYRITEQRLIDGVRKDNHDKAAALFNKIGPLFPGTVRVSNSIFDFTTDSKTARFSTIGYTETTKVKLTEPVWKLELIDVKFPVRDDCYGLAENMWGFQLKLTDERNGKSSLIANDTRIPKSRACPLGNRIEKIISYDAGDSNVVLVVLVRFSHPGFEGADGNLLAITTRVKN